MVQEKMEYKTNNLRSTLAQICATLGFSILSLNVGLIFCMPTIVIGALRTDNSTMALSESQASWFGTLMYITQPLGSISSGVFQDYLGRKLCLLLINIPQLMGWLIMYFSTSVDHLYIASVLFGLSMGFLEAPIVAYIGEITQPRLRGVLSCFAGVLYNVGFMIETFLGAVLPWRSMVLLSAFSPLVGFLAMSLLPESPAWLVSKGRVRDAERAYQWLRGWVPRETISPELEDMINYVKETQGTKRLYSRDYKPVATNEGDITPKKSKSMFHAILEPGVLKAFRIVLIYFAIMSCVTLFAMRPFFIEILNKLGLPMDSHYIVAICGGLQSLGAISMGLTLRPLGKRGVSFLSLGLSISCCLGLALYLVLELSVPWVPVTLFALSYYAASLGVLSIPWLLTIELFPLRARGIASGICAAAAYIFLSIVIKTYYNLEAWFGVSGTCFFYGIIGILGAIYLFFDLPETEGVTLEEIEMRMGERRPKKIEETFKDVVIQRKEEM